MCLFSVCRFHLARACHAEGVADGDGAAVHVELGWVDAECALHEREKRGDLNQAVSGREWRRLLRWRLTAVALCERWQSREKYPLFLYILCQSRSTWLARATTAKASLSSHRSMSSTVRPWRAKSLERDEKRKKKERIDCDTVTRSERKKKEV